MAPGTLPVKSAAGRRRISKKKAVRRHGDHTRKYVRVSKFQRAGRRARDEAIHAGHAVAEATVLVYATIDPVQEPDIYIDSEGVCHA